MEKNIHHDMKYVELWLTKAEAADAAFKKNLKPLYALYKSMKYRVVVFESGTECLADNTKYLLRHAMEVEAKNEKSAIM